MRTYLRVGGMMPKCRRFKVTGLKPAYGKVTNDYLNHLDLGITGVFVSFACEIIATLDGEASKEKLQRQAPAIKSAFESLGYRDILVVAEPPYFQHFLELDETHLTFESSVVLKPPISTLTNHQE